MSIVNSSDSYPRDKSLVELFKRQVSNFPDKVAIKYGSKSLTYRELDSRANKVAQILTNFGATSNENIGISTIKSVEMVVGILAILKIGAVYVPLDTAYPKKNQLLIINDTKLRFYINTGTSPLDFNNVQVINICDLDDKQVDENYDIKVRADLPAYINFTSGTTGHPKGIICTHRGVIRLFFNQNYISFSSETITLNSATLSFDAATFEIWGALLHGGTCILLDEPVLTPQKLRYLIAQEKINTLFLTTALFNSLVDIDVSCFNGLKTLLIGGEVCSLNHVRKLYLSNDEVLVTNIYGPTENTTFTCYYPIPRSEIETGEITIPIGKAIAHTDVYILDSEGKHITLPGLKGELCISGDGLATGYLNQEILTNEKFITDPFTRRRLYKSGDYCQYRPDMQIEFIGRIDSEVKINGYRINLQYVENQLIHSKEIRSAAIIVQSLPSGLKILVAFVVSNGKKNELKFRKYLEANLPTYMMPQKIIWKDTLPLSSTGKIDRTLLSKELSKDVEKVQVCISGEIENKLISMWCNVLGIDAIRENVNFFSLGGNSLLLMHLDALIQNEFNISIKVDEFYKNPTIEGLITMISNNPTEITHKQITPSLPIYVELAPNQRRFFRQYKIDPYNTNMNIVFSTHIKTKTPKRLVSSVKNYILSIRIFRSKLVLRHNQLMIAFDPRAMPEIKQDYYDSISEPELLTQESSERNYYFNLFDSTPLRLKISISKGEVFFVFNIHHLFFDGASMDKLKKFIRLLAAGEILNPPAFDYLSFCMEQSFETGNKVNHKLIDRFKEKYCSIKEFSISNRTNKNESSPAQGYQLSINKLHKEILGISKFLWAFQEIIYQTFDKKELSCQIPISRNKIGEYANVLGYFIEVIIFQNTMDQTDSIDKKIKKIEDSLHESLSFIGVDFLDLVQPKSRFDFSSILFNYIHTDEPLENKSGYFPYEKSFYRELLIFVFENETSISLKIVFNQLIFTLEDMKHFTQRFKLMVDKLLRV